MTKIIVTFVILRTRLKTEKLHNGYEQTNVLLFQCSIEHSTWKHTHVYCCGKHKFAMKALMCNTYCIIVLVQLTERCSSTKHSMHCCFHCNNGYAITPRCYDIHVRCIYFRILKPGKYGNRRSHWPRGLRRRSTATRVLRSWFRIPPMHGCLPVGCVVCSQVEVSAAS
jgi:hypothetical protein